MMSIHSTTTGISNAWLGPRLVPFDGDGGGTGDGAAPKHQVLGGTVAAEMLVEDLAVKVGLLGLWGVVGESEGSGREHLIGDQVGCVDPERVDPSVADAIRKLLLGAPQDRIREKRRIGGVKGLAKDVLFDPGSINRALPAHLLDRVSVGHHQIDQVAIQERYGQFKAPSSCRFVGPQAIVLVQPLQLTRRLALKLLRVGGIVIVRIPTKYLVRTLSTQNQLDPKSFDPP